MGFLGLGAMGLGLLFGLLTGNWVVLVIGVAIYALACILAYNGIDPT